MGFSSVDAGLFGLLVLSLRQYAVVVKLERHLCHLSPVMICGLCLARFEGTPEGARIGSGWG